METAVSYFIVIIPRKGLQNPEPCLGQDYKGIFCLERQKACGVSISSADPVFLKLPHFSWEAAAIHHRISQAERQCMELEPRVS